MEESTISDSPLVQASRIEIPYPEKQVITLNYIINAFYGCRHPFEDREPLCRELSYEETRKAYRALRPHYKKKCILTTPETTREGILIPNYCGKGAMTLLFYQQKNPVGINFSIEDLTITVLEPLTIRAAREPGKLKEFVDYMGLENLKHLSGWDAVKACFNLYRAGIRAKTV